MRHLNLIIFLLLISSVSFAQKNQKKIEIINADFTYVNNKSHPDYWRLIGNVNINHDQTEMFCDSAHYFSEKEKIIAYENVKVKKGDSINISGDILNYDGENKIAIISKNVILINKENILNSQRLIYNIQKKKISFNSLSKISKGNQKISAKKGIYNTINRTYQFIDSVNYHSNNYHIITNSLISEEKNQVTILKGPSRIFFDNKVVFCEKANLYEKENRAEFFKNTSLKTNKYILFADSLFFDKKNNNLTAKNNVLLVDSINNFFIESNNAKYIEDEKKMIFDKNPLLNLVSKEDTLFVKANEFQNQEILNKETLYAFNNVEILNNEIKGKCDSLTFSISDSLIHMYEKPLLWIDEYQISADSMSINYYDKTIKKLFLISNPIIISEQDSSLYNQIKGKYMEGDFLENKLKNIDVLGNAQSIYFIKENKEIIGMNYIESSNIYLSFKKNRIDNINYKKSPYSITTPLEEIIEEKKYLKGFNWKIQEKPERNGIFNQQL